MIFKASPNPSEGGEKTTLKLCFVIAGGAKQSIIKVVIPAQAGIFISLNHDFLKIFKIIFLEIEENPENLFNLVKIVVRKIVGWANPIPTAAAFS
jgi:hypothetical protein